MLSGKNLYFVQSIVVNVIKSIDAPAENSVPLYVFLPGSHSSFGMKRRSRKKINKDVQDRVTSFRVFFSLLCFLFFSKYQYLLCWSKIWDDRISFTRLLGLSGTVRILAKKKIKIKKRLDK